MAGSVNKVILVGNLGRDPEVRRLNSGAPVVNLRIATSESWRDKATGERQERTEWHNVVIFNENLAKIAEQYLKKGSKVYSRASSRPASGRTRAGRTSYTTEVVLPALPRRADAARRPRRRRAQMSDGRRRLRPRDADGARGGGGGARAAAVGRRSAAAPSYAEELDDEIPF